MRNLWNEPRVTRVVTGLLFITSITLGCNIETAPGEFLVDPGEPIPHKPCAMISATHMDFGEIPIMQMGVKEFTIASCGNEDAILHISHISLTANSDDGYHVDPSEMRMDYGDDHPQPILAPTPNAPLALGPNMVLRIPVYFSPQTVESQGHQGAVWIQANDPTQPTLTVELQGTAREAKLETTCDNPTANATIEEGQEVTPQTVLHLASNASSASGGTITSWKWTVDQPIGSQSFFVPSDTFPNPTFEANVAGEYTFYLEVWDEKGEKSKFPWSMSVMALPADSLHIELLWHTPGDPDEMDEGPEAGSDMDLHFVHDEYAKSGPDLDGNNKPDPWFDQPFDCFWFNAHPNWGSFDPIADDDPGLDRDDTDGAGPENLNLNEPENGATYRVGVHYWHDHGYGDSLATVRIYIYGELVAEFADVSLTEHDLWDVATIHWGENGVDIVPNWEDPTNPAITPDYQNPFFFQP